MICFIVVYHPTGGAILMKIYLGFFLNNYYQVVNHFCLIVGCMFLFFFFTITFGKLTLTLARGRQPSPSLLLPVLLPPVTPHVYAASR